MVEFREVSKSYDSGYKAINKVSLRIEEHEIMVLLGASGCGKTTLLRLVNRLLEPDNGWVSVAGRNVKDWNHTALRLKTGYVIQQNGLFPHMTVEENISIVPRLKGCSRKQADDIVSRLLSQFRLDPQQHSKLYPAQLSGGQQQRVGIARALAADPPLVLMDEPFGSLDAVTRSTIINEVLELNLLKNKTVLLVTHDISEAFKLADRICLLQNGNVVALGTPKELLFHNGNPILDQFISQDRQHLELQIVTIADLWPFLEAEALDHEQGAFELTTDTPIINAIEVLSNLRAQPTYAVLHGSGRILTLEMVMSAFRKYKQHLHERA